MAGRFSPPGKKKMKNFTVKQAKIELFASQMKISSTSGRNTLI